MFDFPNNPTANQIVIGQRGEAYIWDGWKWVAGAGPTPPPGTLYLPISGGTMTGPLTLAANATQPMHAVPLQQVGALSTGGAVVVAPGGSIQAAHDALPAGGGSIVLSANTVYNVTATINFTKPNVHISAPSWSTILQRDAAFATGPVIFATGAGFVCEGFTIDGNSVVNTAYFDLNVAGDNGLVRHMQMLNSAGNGSIALGGNNSRATGNRIIGLNINLGTERGAGIWAVNHQTVLIDHNIINGMGIDGIECDGEGTQVIGNRIWGCHWYTGNPGGQIVTYPLGTTGSPLGNGISVIGNSVGPGGSGFAHGIEAGAPNMMISGNVVEGVGGYGILVVSGGSTITGNYIRNCGAANIDGIEVLANCSDFIISGNRIADDRTPAQMRAGIWINPGSSDRYSIVGNLIMPNEFAGIVDQGTGQNKTVGFNTGFDNIIPQISTAATLQLPDNPVIYLLGTGAQSVTAMNITNDATGRTVTLITQGTVTFFQGTTIRAPFVSTAEVPFQGVFDGAQWRFG